ncbi:SpoIID/LytB domain-containing protein [Prochlorococcus marinus]|uniref:SpoIID/LytB domain-containing protein n=1 Tax=Prochlorococcus marinus TaxID=1219 RepID=UPI0022B5C500|nr:SpoIID/LytB domain-containing protein [Prochlorococcus marinus]
MIKSYLQAQKSFFVLGFFLLIGVHYSNQVSNANPRKVKFFKTHEAPPETPLISTEKNVLLVGIEPYLGKEIINDQNSPSLKLVSNGRNLILKDADGVIRRAKEINIGWRAQQLLDPKVFIRHKIGPFASFESAERLANDLKEKGIESTIAHPFDWEVWVAGDIPIPPSIKSTYQKIQVAKTVLPYLNVNDRKIALTGPISLHAPDGLRWEKGIYMGPFSIQADAYGSWTLVEHVPIERYLTGVVPYEIGANSPAAALAAQAVLARTWALANSHRFKVDGYNLCRDTQCQVYKDPSNANQTIKTAIKKTAGKILTWNKKPINTVYHATNGGVMASVDEAWSINKVPYLQMRLDGPKNWTSSVKLPLSNEKYLKSFLFSKSDAFGSDHPLFRWERTIESSQIFQQLNRAQKVSRSFYPNKIEVVRRGSSGRVTLLQIDGKTGPGILLKLDDIRRVLRQLPSTLFVVKEIKEGKWLFSGGGFGHGAGMSQAGAIELAKNGWTTKQILSHYYPKTKYGFLP